MLLLRPFFMLSKLSRSKFEEEGDREATRRGEGLQRGSEPLGKENEKKERRREKEVHVSGLYRFMDLGDSWLIGDDTTRVTNAYVDYKKGCELNLTIPRELKDESGKTKKVEVIGQYAFYRCGAQWEDGITRSVVLTRYIKVIKTWAFGGMDDVTSFEIEEESCLQSIEYGGLTHMSFKNYNDDDRKSILVLPSTVISIAADGLVYNNLIKTIYYCGSTHLSNYSDLENIVNAPDIKVTNLYKYGTIFGNYKPNKSSSSISEAEEKCKSYGFAPKVSPSPSLTEEGPILSKYSKLFAATHLLKS